MFAMLHPHKNNTEPPAV